MEARIDMPMRLIVRTAALVVTSGIAVTALLARSARRHTVPGKQAAWVSTTPLWPLRVCFTLQYKTSGDVLSKAFARVGAESREAMSRAALDGWLERYSGFGEWPIKRPVEMTVEIAFHESAGGRPRGVLRFQRLFSDAPVEVRSVSRVEDRLFQDNDVASWVMSNGTGTVWTVADLEHAHVRVRAVYLSFDDEDFEQPPRFETLHLCFGEPARGVFSFTAAQLAAPAIGPDPEPLMSGPFFKTLLLEYELSLSQTVLAEQLQFGKAGI